VKKAFYNGILASLVSIILNFTFKVITANVILKSSLTLYFTTIDIFTLTLLILVGFRSSMVVTFAQIKNPQMIVNIFRGVLIFIVLTVWAFIIPFLKHKMGVDIHYWYLVATVLGMSLSIYYSNIIAMYRLYGIINFVTFLEPLVALFWFCIAYFIFHQDGIRPLFIATIMSTFIVSFYIYKMSKKHFPAVSLKRPILDDNAIKFIKNSVISTVEFGSGIVLLYVAVLIMIKYFSTDELGDFQVVTKPIFSYMVMLFVFPIFRFVLPELSKLIHEKKFEEINSLKNWILRYAFIVSGIFIVVSMLFSSELIGLLFPQEYINASLMVKHLSFFFIFLILNSYQISFIKASGAFLSAMLIRLFGIVSLIVIFFIIYNFYSKNVISVIVALVSSYLIMFGISFIVEKKILRELKHSHKIEN